MSEKPRANFDSAYNSELIDANDEKIRNLGNAALAATSLNIQKKETGPYTKENVKNYIMDRSSDNLDILEHTVGKEGVFIDAYKGIIEEYPILRTVALVDDSDCGDNAWFRHAAFQSDSVYAPQVGCNLSHGEEYAFSPNEKLEDIPTNSDKLGTAYFIKRLAFSVGADWKQCAKNVKLNADATLLHEFGHAHDFIENYIRPEYDKTDGDSRGAEVLCNAVLADRTNRSEYQRRGPNLGGRWLERGSGEWYKNSLRLKAMGIDNYDEYLYAVHQYYRDMPDESYADRFAYDYIIKHYDKYFTTDKSEHSERIFVDENREIELDPDFVHILGIKQGLGVEIDRLDEGKKSVKHVKGYLALNLYVGKSVYLYENGDPKNPGEKWRIAQGVSEITLKPSKDEETGEIKHFVFFKDAEGVEYHISRTHEEPVLADASPAEMAADLGLKNGDKVQLIKHLPEKDARKMTIKAIRESWYPNWTIDGTVKNIDRTGKDANAIISFYDNDCDQPLNLAYPPKRKWNTYYVGNYEILPLPEK